MSPLESTISGTLLPGLTGINSQEKWLNCTRDYPWYPLPWLMLAKTDNGIFLQKANLWFDNEQRLHWILHSKPWQEDEWLRENLVSVSNSSNDTTDNEQDISVTNESLADQSERFITKNPERDLQGSLEPAGSMESDFRKIHSADLQSITKSTQKNTPSELTIAVETPDKNNEAQEHPAQTQSPVITNALENECDKSNPSNPSNLSNLSNLSNSSNSSNSSQIEPLAFEPYHSVDYFASQGIKLTLPAEPKDTFDRQLKSFTQWLKVMKKVTVKESNTFADPAVEAQANESVSGKEIITEAMAMVLEKQGKYQKAVGIYEKLLLLHPEKSVFFAARIEELKNKL